MEEGVKAQKPMKPKPIFYACCFPFLQKIAKERGYNLLLHGSMDRDMDLVAVPWSDSPSSHYDLISNIDLYVRGIKYAEESFESGYMFSILPGGRSSYVVNINRSGPYNDYIDQQYYLDISITPFPNA